MQARRLHGVKWSRLKCLLVSLTSTCIFRFRKNRLEFLNPSRIFINIWELRKVVHVEFTFSVVAPLHIDGGSRDGVVVRALASHQCGLGSIPGLGIICGLSLLLVLVSAPRVFLRVLRFSSLLKNQPFQIPIRTGNNGEKSLTVDSTEIPIYLFDKCAKSYHLKILKKWLSCRRTYVKEIKNT